MNIDPKEDLRYVALDVQTLGPLPQALRYDCAPADPPVIAISLLIDDGQKLTEHSLVSDYEPAILRAFWNALKPRDLLIGLDSVEKSMSWVRQRSLLAGIRPADEFDLQRFFSHDIVEVLTMWGNCPVLHRPSLDDLGEMLDIVRYDVRLNTTVNRWSVRDLAGIRAEAQQEARFLYEALHRLAGRKLPDRYFGLPRISSDRRTLEIVFRRP
ncbi:hypothetical protein SAMN05421819_3093 [Bryocella elongata]|uniref:Uncharacterized protein n=1 Tax=Bryocella elongata TaxID=863522 RepID=A0A1H6AE94_9BACT|nr:hypothetical protein [Bryocella elongata]SEG46811.1 hypothetical protein SAMN05421819_3093 [Bryocella elongata]